VKWWFGGMVLCAKSEVVVWGSGVVCEWYIVGSAVSRFLQTLHRLQIF
jgi:hypothetical protein